MPPGALLSARLARWRLGNLKTIVQAHAERDTSQVKVNWLDALPLVLPVSTGIATHSCRVKQEDRSQVVRVPCSFITLWHEPLFALLPFKT
jgi:hypothetical protein